MRRVVLIALCCCAQVCLSVSVARETYRQQEPERVTVVESDRRPDLALQYSDVIKFKLASRKTTYRVGELMSLDVALLNVSSNPIYVQRPFQPNFHVRGLTRQGAQIVPYVIYEYFPSGKLYELLEPMHLTSDSFSVLVGCDARSASFLNRRINAGDDREEFENALFVDFGSACLDVRRPGTYEITIEEMNWHVRVSPGSQPKTAIGSIRTNPFKIRIIG